MINQRRADPGTRRHNRHLYHIEAGHCIRLVSPSYINSLKSSHALLLPAQCFARLESSEIIMSHLSSAPKFASILEMLKQNKSIKGIFETQKYWRLESMKGENVIMNAKWLKYR